MTRLRQRRLRQRRQGYTAACGVITVLLACRAAYGQEGLEAAQLTTEGLANFGRLVERARQGDLGNDVESASFHFSFKGLGADGAIRFEIVDRRGKQNAVMLLRPPQPRMEAPPHFFVLFPDDDAPAVVVQKLAGLLDDVFTTNPWAGDPNAYRPRWHVAGYWAAPVGGVRAASGILLLIASTAAGLLFLFAIRPRSEAERLFGDSGDS